ncbi:MAG: DNA alkylation repair protein [Acetobacteraceae bacterium]|nr:DNA alkylation repair protein [Acetobacteraceae bacterium]
MGGGDRAAASRGPAGRAPLPYRRGETTSGRASEAAWARILGAVEAEDRPALAGVLVRDHRMATVGAVSEALANAYLVHPDFVWSTLESFSRDPRRILRCCYGFGLLGERFVPFERVWPHLERLLDEELEAGSWTVRECNARGLLWLMWNRFGPRVAGGGRDGERGEGRADAPGEGLAGAAHGDGGPAASGRAGARGAAWDARPGQSRPRFGPHDPLYAALAAWRDGPSVNLRRAAVMGMFFAQRLTQYVPAALDFVEPLLNDGSQYVRRNLGPFLLSSLGCKPGAAGQAVVDRLRAWAESGDQNARWNVASAFRAQLGIKRPADGLEILESLAADSRLGVRRAVTSALVHIGRRHPSLVLRTLSGWTRDPLRRAVAEAARARLGAGRGAQDEARRGTGGGVSGTAGGAAGRGP